MESNLEEFLIDRGIDTEKIAIMKAEMMDMAAILAADEVELKIFIEKYGDRVAVRDFCRRGKSKSKESLIEKLKRKIEDRSSNGRRNDDISKSGPSGLKRKMKDTRIIAFGWIRNNVQVRSKNGGGIRRVSVPKIWTKKELLQKAIQLFFPGEEDSVEVQNCKLFDFRRNEFDDDFTVERIFEVTGITTCTFYLNTIQHPNCSSPESSASVSSIRARRTNFESPVKCPQNVSVTSSLLDDSPKNSAENIVFEFPELLSFNNEIPIFEESLARLPESSLTETIKVTVHRGNTFKEFIEIFKNITNMENKIEIQMLLPNNTFESALDGGGVYRDALCEFWNQFYDICCTGNDAKVPTVRHDYDETTWQTIGKILLHGYRHTQYFPAKLSRSFVEYILFGEVFCDIQKSLIEYLVPCDAVVLKKTLENPLNIDLDEVNDVLDNLNCKTLINSENVSKVIQDISHTELIQKPMFIINAWIPILRGTLIYSNINEIYETKKVNNRNVLKLIKNGFEDISQEQEKVLSFLKRFIREVNTNVLENFLRFCTGSDVITVEEIQIIFNETSGLQRMPIAHTCTSLLELSINYSSYNEFKYEINSVLSSNVWVMDII